MNIEEVRRQSLLQYADLRRKALFEAQQNSPIVVNAAAGASGGGSTNVEPITYNFDVTATDWGFWNIVDEASFITFLASGGGGSRERNSFTGISVTDFIFEGDRIRCNVTATTSGTYYLNELGITDVVSLGDTTYINLNLEQNSLTEFDVQLSSSCVLLILADNDLTSFNPTTLSNLEILILSENALTEFDPIALPTTLRSLSLQNNQLTFFNPSVSTNNIINLDLGSNLITTLGWEQSEPWANSLVVAPPSSKEGAFGGNINTVFGTQLSTILGAKGFNISG
jgi:hypothetical protein